MESITSYQRSFFNTNATKDISFRINQLSRLEKVLNENMQDLEAAIYKDFRKSKFENYLTEFSLVFHDIKQAKRNLYRWSRKKKIPTNLTNFPAKCYSIPEPLGVCLVIGAWNYPYQLSLSPAIAAIAAGNTVVLKPSELPSETSAILTRLINDNFDASFFKVIQGGVAETTELLKQKFDKIFFTGSTKVGKIVYRAAAENLTPVTLELGGKSPTFITKGAHLKMAAKRIIWAKYLNAGQTCIAPDYILIDQTVSEEFLTYAKLEVEKVNYSFTNGNYLKIINNHNFDRLQRMIDSDKVYCGGENDRSQRYIAPTILKNVSFDDACMQEEIFGPILPVIVYRSLDDVISKVKAQPKPLSCYVFTNDAAVKKKILNEISFGGGAINEALMHITNPNLPFGGVGNSGIGSYHGEAGFRTFSHYKSILEKPTWLEFPIKYSPYSATKLKWLKRMLKFQ
ncbi:aldehyde dehydrogenase [Patiriisocius sp. Uisw_017]|jgi:aldehyde dehydrogenase (NAD+)|uniref:aldehyde dehydrogenase n=1 Tax=Patiriisocius sp. Uisw_017 TaxID=3230968 RepID=UPI0039E7F733